MQIDPTRYQHFKIEGKETLFDKDMTALDKKACPVCWRKLKYSPFKKLYWCSRHKPSFAIKEEKLLK